jgi:hypothetical protein
MPVPQPSLTGTLDVHGFDKVLRGLAAGAATGTLQVGHSAPAWFVLVGGRVALAGRRGGTPLRTLAAATFGQHELADIDPLGGDPAVAAALVDRFGDAAGAVVRDHVVATVFEVLLPSSEPFAFTEALPPPLPDALRFDVEDVLADALERVHRWRLVAESIPSVDAVFRPRRSLAPDVPSVEVSADEWVVLSVLDGRRNVGQTIAAAGRSSYDVCSALHGLLSRGLVERVS